MLFNILSIGGGVLAGVILALKVIAPRTGNKVDDAVLLRLEQLESLLRLFPGGADALSKLDPADAPKVTTDAQGVVTRDHRA